MHAAWFQWKLNFQTGLLAGKALHLPAGALTVGGQSGCDLYLPELKAEQNDQTDGHCTLQVSADSVSLQPQHLRCKVNGRRVKADRIPLRAGQTVEVEGCQFSLAYVGNDDAITHAVTAPKPAPRYLQLAQKLGRPRWLIALPGAICLLLALLQAQSGLLRAAAPQRMQFDLSHYQQALHSAAGLEQVQVRRDSLAAGGVLTLSGRCRKTAALAPFLNRLIEAGVVYRNQVVCEDELQRSVLHILQANGYRDARVEAGAAPGAVVIAGSIRADARWAAVARQLNRLAGLQAWTVNNETDAKLNALVEILRQNGLLTQLSITHEDDTLTVTGQLPAQLQQQLQQALSEWRQRNRRGLRVVYQNIPAAALEADIFPAQVTGFSGNDRSAFLQLADGMKVQAGSALPSGYLVTNLDQNGIELRKEGQWLHFPLGNWK